MGANTCHLDLLGLLQAMQPEQSHEASPGSRIWKINFLLGIEKEERKEGEEQIENCSSSTVCVCMCVLSARMWGHTCGVQVLVHVKD